MYIILKIIFKINLLFNHSLISVIFIIINFSKQSRNKCFPSCVWEGFLHCQSFKKLWFYSILSFGKHIHTHMKYPRNIVKFTCKTNILSFAPQKQKLNRNEMKIILLCSLKQIKGEQNNVNVLNILISLVKIILYFNFPGLCVL